MCVYIDVSESRYELVLEPADGICCVRVCVWMFVVLHAFLLACVVRGRS